MPEPMIYVSDEKNGNFPLYPDTVDMSYHQSVYKVEDLPSFCGGTIRSLRTDIALPRKAIDKAYIRNLADNAKHKEDFHNYDYIDGHQGQWGRCRCELRIITGEECGHHFEADAEGKTPSSAQDHWAWVVDIAPRGKICPVAKWIGKYVMGEPLPCNIMLGNDGPSSAWVLAQDEGAKKGTKPGRIKDMVLSKKKCLKCQDASKVDQETNKVISDQKAKEVSSNSNPIIQPMLYKPPSGICAHWSLEVGKYYHKDDVWPFRAVPAIGGVGGMEGVYASDLLMQNGEQVINYGSFIAPDVDGPVFLISS